MLLLLGYVLTCGSSSQVILDFYVAHGRALYDGFAMAFSTQLHPGCIAHMEGLIADHLLPAGTSAQASPCLVAIALS